MIDAILQVQINYDSQITAIIKQMDTYTPHSKYTRKDRMKTIGTIDTYDCNPADTLYNQENRPKNGSRIKNTSKSMVKKKISTTALPKHNKSLNSMLAGSTVNDCTPKNRIKRLMSITHDAGRLKTDYNQPEPTYAVRRIVSELKKKLVFPNEDSYRMQAYKVLKMVYANKDEQIFTVKMGGRQDKKYTLIKTTEQRARHYDRQSKARQELIQQVPKKDGAMFLRVHNIWREKKHYTVIQDNYLNPTWSEDKFYLFLNQLKNSPAMVKSLMAQLTATIQVLSKTKRAHSRLNLDSVYFPLWRGNLKIDGLVKLGNLSQCIHVNNKKQLLNMPISYHTPPEILNFILFEEGEDFDREHLQHLQRITEGWQIDVWSLGIMVLEVLNGGPLAGEATNCHKIVELQRQVLIRYSYLLEKLDPGSRVCLSKMLSFNPHGRPHPVQILATLGEQ